MQFSTALLSVGFLASAVLTDSIEERASTCDNCAVTAIHTVVSGETLGGIATAAGITLAQITFVNPGIANINSIAVGLQVNLTSSACNTGTTPVAAAEITATCSNGTASTYTVVEGDTMTIIANNKFGITLAALVAANPQITNIDLILVGQVINIPLCAKKARRDVEFERRKRMTRTNKGKAANVARAPLPDVIAACTGCQKV